MIVGAFVVPAWAKRGAVTAPLLAGILWALPPQDKPENYTEKIPGTEVTFDLVRIAGGEFEMGSPDAEAGREADEGPVRKVTVEPFWIGKAEVTWDEFELWYLGKEEASDADAVSRPTPSYGSHDRGWGRGKRPAMSFSWLAAKTYCEWFSKKTGREYRLPTEAEWEFACRGGAKTKYFFGDDAEPLGEYAWYRDNADDLTQETAKKKPNPFGLYDMLGNVAEYCLNPYTETYDVKDPPPIGPGKSKPVVRGGSWNDPAPKLRCANRQIYLDKWNERDPQRPRSKWWLVDGTHVGFRVARSR